ncbi:hypothetical protein EJO69_10015 [Flaviflexus salsibiostraticola]|uniref:Uncharacterized protein n=1 Tax=Flaviflexus salsibiostraticola TaxID=1282737 RepID=A0A3Q8WV27_9ACTO|nr:hypothetical protein [Flaviflexus salsibiostraticola]AZN30597.1 hypothetical protein EJO69_10015 [Flaviflexus salsibiostraticola]
MDPAESPSPRHCRSSITDLPRRLGCVAAALDEQEKVVLAAGVKPKVVLEGAENLAPEVFRIGDAKEARNAVSAIWEGANFALKL